MAGPLANSRARTLRLILIPSVLTLAVTLLRLAGELQHWSRTYYNPEVGGGGSLVGITWPAPIFGIYFAAKLTLSGEGPRSRWRAVGLAVLGVAVVFGFGYLGSVLHVDRSFHLRLLHIWLVFAMAALVTWPGWPALFKTLAAYAFAARVPVAIIMFLAMLGGWGTHYDVAPSDTPPMGLVSKWLWLGFFPQMVLWVGFTIVTGMFFGALAAGLIRLVRRSSGLQAPRADQPNP